jgi:hypothetical protein
MCARVCNQQSRGVVIARLRSSVWSLLHQHRDLHQSTYLYLSKDRELISHQVISDFRLPVRYYRQWNLVVRKADMHPQSEAYSGANSSGSS